MKWSLVSSFLVLSMLSPAQTINTGRHRSIKISSGSHPTFLTGDCAVAGAAGGTVTFDATGGNFIWGGFIGYQLNPPTFTGGSPNTTDVQGNTITALTPAYFRSSDVLAQMFYEENPASMGAGHSLMTTAPYSVFCYAVFSGMKTSSSLDPMSYIGTHSDISGGGCQPGSETPSTGSSVTFSMIASDGATNTVDLMAFSANQFSNVAYGTTFGGRASYVINSGTVNPTWTPNSGGSACANVVFLGN